MPVLPKERLRFGPFEFDAQSAELFKFGQKLKLQGQPIQILSILLENPGALVTREELRQRLWPAETPTFVDFDHGLNTSIRKLRSALGDEAETPRYIETLPRRGYRFIGELTADRAQADNAGQPAVLRDSGERQSGTADIASSMAEAVSQQRRRSRYLGVALACLPVLVALGVFFFRSARNAPNGLVLTGTRQLTYLGDVNGRVLTDGRRIYFTSGGKNPLRYVSVNGGEETVIPCPVSRWVDSLKLQ